MDVKELKNVHVLNHPLLTHKISKIREEKTKTNYFRQLVKEISIIEGYEALRDLPTFMKEIKTPVEMTTQPFINPRKLCFVPILRAGLGMSDGLLELVPGAHCGHIGLYRDEVTHEPHEYYCKLPDNIQKLDVYVCDPMLATGGSAIDAVRMLQKHGVRHVKGFICIIAAPEGVETFSKAFPDIPLYIGALDRCLNEKAYICPGLGDCGDRIFGTAVSKDDEE